jgi:hypothetical protein
VRRIGSRTYEQQIDYHLRDGRAIDFSVAQAGRVELARFLIDKILKKELRDRPLRFVELGCGAGDITGPYASAEIEVHGWDVVPAAEEACARRWPAMAFNLQPVEEAQPMDCDILVMTEFLEHVVDPERIVRDWLPRAKWAVIGHPLNEPDPPFEPGHIWSYTLSDWEHWFELGNHHYWERFRFPMAGWEEMVMGHSQRKAP